MEVRRLAWRGRRQLVNRLAIAQINLSTASRYVGAVGNFLGLARVIIRIVAIHGGGFRNRKSIKIILYLFAF